MRLNINALPYRSINNYDQRQYLNPPVLDINSRPFISRYPYFGLRNNQRENRDRAVGLQSNNDEKNHKNSLENLLSIPQIIDSIGENEEERKKNISLEDFHKNNLNNLKEDLVYYFSSPDSLKRFKSSNQEEIKYDFYSDLNCQNFSVAQNARFKLISLISNSDIEKSAGKNKLSDYYKNFCSELSLVNNNTIETKEKFNNANLLGSKMDEFFYLLSEEDTDNNKLLSYLKDLNNIFASKPIDMQSLGIIHFNFIEKNLISILTIIENKIVPKNNKKILNDFSSICIDILKSFTSSKLYFYIIFFLRRHINNLDLTELNMAEKIIHFIPNDCFDFTKLNQMIQTPLIKDIRKPLIDKGIIKIDLKEIDQIRLNLVDYRTLYYDNYLLLFIHYGDYIEIEEEIGKKERIFFYYKIDLINKNKSEIGAINLLTEEDVQNGLLIVDTNFSIKKDFVYIFYIIDDSIDYFLRIKIYNKHQMRLLKEDAIKLKKDFIPIKLYNDNKYLYCISLSNEILMIKRNYNLDYQKYLIGSFRLFENDLLSYEEITDLSDYQMYNSLYFNNLFFLQNKYNKVIPAKLFIKNNDTFILNIYNTSQNSINDESIKIIYNNNRFIITKFNEYPEEHTLLYDMTSKDFNHLIDKGIKLLPFDSNISNHNYPDNIYEYLIQEYSSLLNLCGNFRMTNEKLERNLLGYPFSLCCNFDENIIYFILHEKIENDNNDVNILNYIIILKQIICSLYNVNKFKEESIKELIPYLKKIILKIINSKDKKHFNKVIKDLMEILSYIKNNTIIEMEEIKFFFDKEYKDINIKSKFLLIELLLKQNQMKNSNKIYEYIIKLEKDYLVNIFKAESPDLSYYHYLKQFMIDASENLYKKIGNIQEEIMSLFPCLLDNILILYDLYKEKITNKNNLLGEYYLLYNSFNFRTFFLIIEYLLANKKFLIKKEIIISLCQLLLIFDKNEINDNNVFDMDNIIEIKNYSLNADYRENSFYRISRGSNIIEINLKTSNNVIIRTNILSNKLSNEKTRVLNSIEIDIKSMKGNSKYNFLEKNEQIYHDIFGINIKFNNLERNTEKINLIINIIPLKDENLYKLYKNNKDLKIISLIGKCILNYLLCLFEGIHSQIEKYNNEDIVKDYKLLFQNDIFKFMSIPINKTTEQNLISPSKFNDVTNSLLEQLDKSIGNIEIFNTLFNELSSSLHKKVLNFNINFDSGIKSNLINNKKDIYFLEEKKYNQLFNLFKYDLQKNRKFIPKENNNLNSLTNKIFLFSIKYYNCYDDLNALLSKIKKMKLKDKEDFKNNNDKIQSLDNYPLFLSLYGESMKIKKSYDTHRSQFNDDNFEEDNRKYFSINIEKIEFLYNNIIPSDDLNLKPNISIIKNLIELLDNNNIGIPEIIQYSKVQNISLQIKLMELSIINNLLSCLNNENNIILLLNYIKNKKHYNNDNLYSFFDNTYCSDYFNLEKLKKQFHVFLNILIDKITNDKNKYSNIVKISLTENLIWKIKGRNFPILFELFRVFEEIKTEKQNNLDECVFILNSNNIYNVKYFNKNKNVQCKFDIFKILVNQIMNILKDIIKYENEHENKLSLERNPSNIAIKDYKKIFDKIISYFIDINPESIYFDDLILFFYRLFINSDILLNFILQNEPSFIKQVIKISFDNKNIKLNTRLIMLKLLCQIIENIKIDNLEIIRIDNLEYLTKILQSFEKENLNIRNPFIHLYDKILKLLDEDSNLEIIIKKYYINLAEICLSKIIKIEKDDELIKKIINNNNFLRLILFYNQFPLTSEDQFSLELFDNNNNNDNKENLILFNSEKNKSIKYGKIICFLDTKFNNNNNIIYNTFDKSSFNFEPSCENKKCNNIFIIMDDFEQLDYYNISNTEIIKSLELKKINNENKYKKEFLENYSKLIIDLLIVKLNKDLLNEKGIYLILTKISNLIKYLNKNDLIVLFKYLWKFYNKNKLNENIYPFMSLEYIEKKTASYFKFNNIKNIYEEKEEKNKTLYSLFNYIIKDNILEISRNLEYINKNAKIILFIPKFVNINDNLDDILTKIYNKSYEISNLSFFIPGTIKEINENSILFTKSINNDSELLNIATIIKNNNNKIKVIIALEINKEIEGLIDFIKENEIPFYTIEERSYEKLIKFFIKGINLNFTLYTNDEWKDKKSIFSLYKLNFNDNFEDMNPIETIIKQMPKDILSKIEKDKRYKSAICKDDKKGYCFYGDKCNYAHGKEELKKIKDIRNYYKNKREKENDIEYKSNINKLYKRLKDETKNIFDIINIKLSKRLLFDIIIQECVKSSDFENIFLNIKNISYVYESLCLEYYFNVSNNIPKEQLKEKLLNIFMKLSNEEIKISDNKWILYYFDQIDKIDLDKQRLDLIDFNPEKLNTEKKLMNIMDLSPNILYDKILFLIGIINSKNNNENFIKYYLNVITKITNNIEKIIEKFDDDNYDSEENLELLLLSNVMDIVYNYYCDFIINKNKKSDIFKAFNIDIAIRYLLEIDLEPYFQKYRREEDFIFEKIIRKETALLIEFLFKYLDFCFVLFLKEDKIDFINYMQSKDTDIFKYYYIYKLLSLEKNENKIDYKEIAALIYHIITSFNKGKNSDQIIIMNANKFNEYEFENKSEFYDLKFIKVDEASSFNKIVIFCFDKKIKKYYYQDIIDLNHISIYDDIYKIRVFDDLYLVPLQNIETNLFSFDNSKTLLSEEDNIKYNLTKYEDFPKYSWNIGYNGKNYLIISEEDNQIYSFNEPKKNNEDLVKGGFTLDKKLETINYKDNKIIGFIEPTETGSSYAYRENYDLLIIDDNKSKYNWLNNEEKQKIEYPIFLENIEIMNISYNYNVCHLVDVDGNLYRYTGKKFIKKELPKNTKRYLLTATGEKYLICLVENDEGKGVIYTGGINNKYQCGINNISNGDIKEFTKCEIDDNLDFKYICTYKGFSAALSSCGKLFIWGSKFKTYNKKLLPTLINEDKENPIIIDKIWLNYDNLYAIGRKLKDGKYIVNLFSLEVNDNYSNSEKKIPFILKEINFNNKKENNSRIIPLKILIGQNRTYFLGVEENKLIEKIENFDEEKENNNQVIISLNYNNQKKKEESNFERIKNIYASDKLNTFIKLFNSFTDENVKNLVKIFDKMKEYNYETDSIYYENLIKYLEEKDKNNEILKFFKNNKKNNEVKDLFNYLKQRIILIEENFLNFININDSLNSIGLFQTLLEQNNIYLNDELRVHYFYQIFLNMREEGYYDYRFNNTNIEISINRIKSSEFIEKFKKNNKENKVPDIFLNETVFGQLFQALGDLEGKIFFRRKGDRLFEVNMGAEGGIDAGGPYREILSNICDDLQSDYVELFIKTPNNKYKQGDLTDKYIINPDCNNINYKKAFQFIGKLMVLAISSGDVLSLNLHPIIWKSLLDNKITFKEYETIDINSYKFIKDLEEILSKKDENAIDNHDLNFVIKNCNGKDVELKKDGEKIKVTLDNLKEYIYLAKTKKLNEIKEQINYIKEGLYSGIGKNILRILNWNQLEEFVCGKYGFDFEDFKRHTKCNNSEKVIQWFWEWLENCKEEDKIKYLRFVTGWTRLPKSDYDYEHKINITFAGKNNLPSSHTCFYTLDLPRYDSKEILFKNMKYAIDNVTNITD